MGEKAKRYLNFLFRFGLALVFAYFGYQGIANPELSANIWVRAEFRSLITFVMPITVFMVGFGVIQLLVAVAILFRIFLWYALVAAAFLLAGIIVNLGISEISLRDFVILTAVLHLLSNTPRK